MIAHINSHVSIASEREKIYDAMRHWEEKTCIRFHPGTNGREGGILFFRGSG